ncbi:MAG: hypothetical protein IJR59_07985 [Firmicutes bacterium]|nr:hypothetical protein [Bacillota bacterium]
MYKLQPLRISAGWTVKYNNFTEYDPASDKDGLNSSELCEDLLQLKNGNILIDLGWYPEFDINGSYALYLVDSTKEYPFDCPLEEFKSKSKSSIINKIEYWTKYSIN